MTVEERSNTAKVDILGSILISNNSCKWLKILKPFANQSTNNLL